MSLPVDTLLLSCGICYNLAPARVWSILLEKNKTAHRMPVFVSRQPCRASHQAKIVIDDLGLLISRDRMKKPICLIDRPITEAYIQRCRLVFCQLSGVPEGGEERRWDLSTAHEWPAAASASNLVCRVADALLPLSRSHLTFSLDTWDCVGFFIYDLFRKTT